MSNVIKNASSVVSTTQIGVIGKIYEELFTDSAGNLTMRYLRVFKAGATVTAGQMVGCNDLAGESEMYETGTCIPTPDGTMPRGRIYGMSISAVASGSYGFCVCRGVVDGLSSHTSVTEGMFLATYATTDGMVMDAGAVSSSGESIQILGHALGTMGSGVVKAYINVL